MAAFAAEFADLCPETIVWEQKTSSDAMGKPSFAPPVQFQPPTGGRREFKMVRKSIPGGLGFTFVQGSAIYLLATPAIGTEDRVYVLNDYPAGYAGAYPTIVGIEQPVDETGQAVYTQITLGAA